jgi:hypothetical protein
MSVAYGTFTGAPVPTKPTKPTLNPSDVNFIILAMTGFFLGLVGIFLHLGRSHLSNYPHLLLPLPPLAVASYVFCLNLVRYNGNVPEFGTFMKELGLLILVSSIFFLIFSIATMLPLYAMYAQR